MGVGVSTAWELGTGAITTVAVGGRSASMGPATMNRKARLRTNLDRKDSAHQALLQLIQWNEYYTENDTYNEIMIDDTNKDTTNIERDESNIMTDDEEEEASLKRTFIGDAIIAAGLLDSLFDPKREEDEGNWWLDKKALATIKDLVVAMKCAGQ